MQTSQALPPAVTNIRAYVRVRPLLPREHASTEAMQVLEDTHIRVVKENVYVESHLDKVFDQDASQEDVYTASKDCIQAALDGYNSCICAYGPTGTGKTYTMFGDPRLGVEDAAYGQDALAGVIPRALVELFERTQSHASASTSATTASLSVSYMEIYNEKIHDLLQPYKPRDKRAPQDMVQKKAGLEVKDRGSQGTFVKGLSARRITTVQQALDVVRKGDQHRAVRHTEMNQHSSRSHTILQVILEQRVANESGLCLLRSKLNFVDLAGSERWNAHHELTDERISEMTSINQSLSALITVVGKLAEEGTTHVPYRDSKLTHLLQDSLGGNSKTLIIATVSPSSAAFEETCSTLKFADRARNIVNRATVNLRLDLKQELALKAAEVRRLQQLVIKYATAMGTGTSTAAPDTAGIVAQLQAEVAGLRSDLVVAKQMLAVERAARRALESRQSSQASEDGGELLASSATQAQSPSTPVAIPQSQLAARRGLSESPAESPELLLSQSPDLPGSAAAMQQNAAATATAVAKQAGMADGTPEGSQAVISQPWQPMASAESAPVLWGRSSLLKAQLISAAASEGLPKGMTPSFRPATSPVPTFQAHAAEAGSTGKDRVAAAMQGRVTTDERLTAAGGSIRAVWPSDGSQSSSWGRSSVHSLPTKASGHLTSLQTVADVRSSLGRSRDPAVFDAGSWIYIMGSRGSSLAAKQMAKASRSRPLAI